jgi:hypothetical protein
MFTVDLYSLRKLQAFEQERFASLELLHQTEWQREHKAECAKRRRPIAALMAARDASRALLLYTVGGFNR